MPDGRTHDAITLVTASFATPLALGLAFENEPGRALAFLGSFLVSGLLFSDDLDIHSIEYVRWKWLRFLWLPYQKLIPHRSWLSHGLIVGPALRILYFAAVFTALLWLVLTAVQHAVPLDATGAIGNLLGAIGRSLIDHPDWALVAFAGLAAGGAVHSIADWLWTWWRHAWRAPLLPSEIHAGSLETHHGMPTPDYEAR